MNWKREMMMTGAALLLAGLLLHWWSRPERQIPRAQARLLSAVEKRDFDALAAMIAADYRDRWKQDRAEVVRRSREVFGQFGILTVVREPRGLSAESGGWSLSEKLTFKGFGGPLALAARDTVNALQAPFVLEWRQRSWRPWDWELKSITQPELELPIGRDAF